ncbi:MAG TPA: CHASE3 domain-containing protein [Terriglobales bacterium]|nr:CHASE3 domain-containing protein [Terriglobales bacterium]
MIRKVALQILAPVLLVAIAVNGYLAVNHLRQVHQIAAMTLQNSATDADISRVLGDLTDMETGERGYLLSGDPSYLQPYADAKVRIATDFAALREALASHTERERALESELETLATSKEAEMEHSINLRQEGYRHRAFKLVATNEGEQYMENARKVLGSLAASQSSSLATFDAERSTLLAKALKETVLTNLGLLAFTACLFLLVRYHGKVLEREAAQSREELASRDVQLQKLTFGLSNQARFRTTAIEENARLLLQNYGGFLPKQGHECAEQIKEASVQMERLRQDLLSSSGNGNHPEVAYESVA